MFGNRNLNRKYFAASKSGDLHVLKQCIRCGVDVETKDSYGWTALLNASIYGRLEIVQYLTTDCLANVVATSNTGHTALHYACQHGHFNIVQYLIEKCDVTMDARTNNGETALDIAKKEGKNDVIAFLISKTAYKKQQVELESTFLNAVAKSDMDVIQQCLQRGVRVDTKNKDGWTALHCASRFGYMYIVKFLISDYHSNVEITTNDGFNALHLACQYGHIEIVQYLVNHANSNVAATTQIGYTALHVACQKGHLNIVQFLIEQCNANVDTVCNNGCNSFHIGCGGQDHIEIVQYMLEHCNINIEATTKGGHTPFLVACYGGCLPMIQYLHETVHVNVNATQLNGGTALHMACYVGHLQVVQYLITYCGALINAKTIDGETPLDVATKEGKQNIAAYLLKKMHELSEIEDTKCQMNGQTSDDSSSGGSNVQTVEPFNDSSHFLVQEKKFLQAVSNGDMKTAQNYIVNGISVETRNSEQWTALHIACQHGHLSLVKFLIQQCHSNIGATTNKGSTALHMASFGGYLEIVEFLICNTSIDLNATNKSGCTALHFACGNGQLKVVEYLVMQCKANVEATEEDNWTPLHSACYTGHLHIVRYLIEECGSVIDARGNNGESPLDLAAKEGKEDCEEYLRKIMKNKLQPADKLERMEEKDQTIFEKDTPYPANHSCEKNDTKKSFIPGKIQNTVTSIGVLSMEGYKAIKYCSSAIDNTFVLSRSKRKSENCSEIISDRKALENMSKDPGVEPLALSLKYVENCTNKFTSRILGEGKYGKVYFGFDNILGLQYAVKRFPLSTSNAETFEEIKISLKHEIAVFKRFRHPNIATLYGFHFAMGQSNQILMYEYLSNGPLSAFLSDKKGRTRLDAKIRLSIMFQVARAINFLHTGGCDNLTICHHDIKSANICLTQNYTAKLIDCGLANFTQKFCSSSCQVSVTPTILHSGSTLFGTVGYTCPAYASGKVPYTASCDMYSFGIVLMELIVGHLQEVHSSQCRHSFEDYSSRHIHDKDSVDSGWKMLMNDADQSADWNSDSLGELCKASIHCTASSPEHRISSSILVDKLSKASMIEFEGISHQQQSMIEESKEIHTITTPCALCHSSTTTRQSISCQNGHNICIRCMEQLIQTQIGQSGLGIQCVVDHCNALFDDDALFGKISRNIYDRYINERSLQHSLEKHLLELKEMTMNHQEISLQHKEISLKNYEIAIKHQEITKQQHQETMNSFSMMESAIDTSTQRILQASAFLATEKKKECPSLVWLVPSDILAGSTAKDWVKWAKNLTLRTCDLYFVCQHSYTVVEPKMQIHVSRQWLIQIGPIIHLSLLILSGVLAGLGASLPFPIPKLTSDGQVAIATEFISSLLDEQTKQLMKKFQEACELKTDLPKLEHSQLLELTNSGYEMIVKKCTDSKRSEWKSSLQPVFNEYGKLIWVKTEYADEYTKLVKKKSFSHKNIYVPT